LTGSLKPLEGNHNLIAYARFNLRDKSIIVINNNEYEISKEITVWHLGIPYEAVMKRLILTDAAGFNVESVDYYVKSGHVTVMMPPLSSIIIRYQEDESKPKKASSERVYFRAPQ
jgi:alpha-glucosidase